MERVTSTQPPKPVSVKKRSRASSRINVGLRATIDYLPGAIFVLAPDLKIIYANQQAEMMLATNSGLRKSRQRLATFDVSATKQLRDVVFTIANHPVSGRTGRALPIPRQDAGRPFQALALPLPFGENAASQINHSLNSLVILVVSDPDFLPGNSTERLQRLFDLTPAEARMANAMAAGKSVSEYAEAVGVTNNTARWTLKQLFSKTGCTRQAELTRQLTTLAATAAIV